MKLANNALRTKNMVALLQGMGINVGMNEEDKTKVSCKDELVILKPATPEEAKHLAGEIQELLATESKKPIVQQFTLNGLLSAEIDAAQSINIEITEKNKRSLQALLPILELDFALDADQEYLNIQLPSIAYAPLFGSLVYKYLKLEGETLRLNLKEFLKDHRDELVLIDGKAPLVLCEAAQFEKKKVFYAQKELSETKVEVTPHAFIPYAAKPPVYTFILDTSGSMAEKNVPQDPETRLQRLQKSAIKLAEALFEFHPDAKINIKQFNDETEEVGSFKSKDLATLRMRVNQLSVDGGTSLFTATLNELTSFSHSTKHTNVLLFTDGENTDSAEEDLQAKIRSIQRGSSLIPARNKFFIISYGVKQQPLILETVAEIFNSPIINTDSADFADALSAHNKMQEWAAARELFTCRIAVAASNSDFNETTYVSTYDLSGQFTALKSMVCKKDDELRLTLMDGDGKVILDDTKPAVKPVAPSTEQLATQAIIPTGSAKTAADIGLFGGSNPLPPTATETLTEIDQGELPKPM